MANITIHRDGSEYGPYALSEVTEYLASGDLDQDDWAASDGMSDWEPLSNVVARLSKLPPPRQKTEKPVTAPSQTSSNAEAAVEEKPETQSEKVADAPLSSGKEKAEKLAGSAYDAAAKGAKLAGEVGGKAFEMGEQALKNAGPTGQTIALKLGKNGMMVAGALVIVGLAVAFYPSGPSSNDIMEASERMLKDTGLDNSIMGKITILNVNKLGCKSSGKGSGYDCDYEIETEILTPDGKRVSKVSSESARFIKGSRGWTATK